MIWFVFFACTNAAVCVLKHACVCVGEEEEEEGSEGLVIILVDIHES